MKRFAKYKGPEIGYIESHNERTKEKYASNPDVDTLMRRSAAGSASSSSARPQSPQLPSGDAPAQVPRRGGKADRRGWLPHAVGQRARGGGSRDGQPGVLQGQEEIRSQSLFHRGAGLYPRASRPENAVVHMDEKTPHMHLCFIPLTEDKRLSAKEIVGNKRKLTQWQDRFWEHMVRKYPDLERGESASETGRDHIPPRLFKEAVHLNRMKEQIMAILNDTNPFNKKAKLDELEALLGKYVPGAEALRTKLKKYDAAYKALTAENAALEKQLGAASKESVLKKLEINEKLRELDELHRMVDGIPPEILQAAKQVVAHKPQER